MKVAFQGEPGAYSEMRSLPSFSAAKQSQALQRFPRCLRNCENRRRFQAGVVPVENSIEGSVNQNYDLFLNLRPQSLRRSHQSKLSTVLIANPRHKLEDVKTVYSHPQALAQCRSFLEKHKWEIIPAYDTAGSVKIIKEKKLLNAAAIASERAAEIYGMQILARDIADNPSNYTRFLVLSHEDAAPTGKDKTSIIFSAKHAPGTLYHALGEFASRNINLTRIESRPTKTTAWEYNFYLDFEGHRTEKRALKH